jgi:hypothetical protein
LAFQNGEVVKFGTCHMVLRESVAGTNHRRR